MKDSSVWKSIGVAFALALVVVAAATLWAAGADDAARGYGPGYGMMGGYYGPGYGPGYGMGPGMMGGYGGYGSGYSMMGGYGPGDGGYGMGPGMMGGYGGYGMGAGMMGYGALYGLDLSDAQREKINKMLDGERKQMWATMGNMMDAQGRLRDLYDADQPDPKKVGAAYADIAKMQRELVESQVRARNEIWNVLTKEQREEWRQWRRGGWAQGWGPPGSAARDRVGPGMMRR